MNKWNSIIQSIIIGLSTFHSKTNRYHQKDLKSTLTLKYYKTQVVCV